MRKVLLVLLVVSLSLIIVVNPVFAANDISIDDSKLNEGVIGISVGDYTDNRLKVQILNGSTKMYYNIEDDGQVVYFPVQFGNGNYRIALLENTKGNSYRYVYKENFKLNLDDNKTVYTSSNIKVNWDNSMEAVKFAKELTSGIENDWEKVETIYNYIINNYSYDYNKLSTLNSTYETDVDAVFSDEELICTDFAVLFAAMLRSLDIPAKYVTGYADYIDGYHAWNEVYNQSTGEWVVIDTTSDSYYLKNNIDYSMIKSKNKFTIKYQY